MSIEDALARLRAYGAVEVTVRFDLSGALSAPAPSPAGPSAPSPPAAEQPADDVDEFSGTGYRPRSRTAPIEDEAEGE